MTSPVEDEFTELVDAEIPRVDLVDKAANGMRFLIAKQADGGQAGLMDPGFVRDLIGKSEPEPADSRETVTMSGSPGAIAKLIHEAALRREAADVAKAPMSTAGQNDLPDSQFAYIEPGGKKDADGKTTPRSKRHFPINDEAHVRNALSRAPQSPFGDKAMPAIRRAAKKFGIEVSKMAVVDAQLDDGVDGMDPTVPLAEPEDDAAPGSPTEPGSPAWEAIDAATAAKWTSILARAKAAIDLLADREMLEAASADPDDAENACDLQDACCAIDYAISVLAPFAVAEQAEADNGAIDVMAAVGKAVADFDTAPLDTIEALGAVAKAGRVLSAANEAAIRSAADSLHKVLTSLPQAPVEKEGGPEVAKTANEETSMPQPTPSDDSTTDSGQEPAMGTQEPEPKPPAGVPVTDIGKAGEKTPMVVVYDQKGRLIGIADPDDITPVANSEADADDMDSPGDAGDPGNEDAADKTSDLTPQPPAEAGTPADAPADGDDDENVTKSETDDNDTTSEEVLKSSLLAAVEQVFQTHSATQTEQIAKTGDAVLELAEMVETLKGRLQVLEEQPAEPRVFANGAVPPSAVLRGHDQGASAIDVAKAREMKRELYRSPDARTQNEIATEMQGNAIARLQEIYQRRAQ